MNNIKRSLTNLQQINRFNFCKLQIGLLGGSFNPPHDGHLSISNYAIKMLSLDYVIWVVASQNPFKPQYHLSINQRANLALKLTDNPKILISTIEQELQYKYSYQTIKFFTNRFPQIKFTWLLGADSFAGMHKWLQSNEIFNMIDVAVFNRSGYTAAALYSKSASKYNLKVCSTICTNKVSFLHTKLCNISSTNINL